VPLAAHDSTRKIRDSLVQNSRPSGLRILQHSFRVADHWSGLASVAAIRYIIMVIATVPTNAPRMARVTWSGHSDLKKLDSHQGGEQVKRSFAKVPGVIAWQHAITAFCNEIYNLLFALAKAGEILTCKITCKKPVLAVLRRTGAVLDGL
jgi:hypothetical protein